MTYRSPLLDLPGAVEADAPDAGIAAHYGSFNHEQRALVEGRASVDLSNRDVLRISGPDRLAYLHSITTQYFEGLQAGREVSALVLDPNGHVEHAFTGIDDGESFVAHTEPGAGPALIDFLDKMRFLMRVEIAPVDDLAVIWSSVGYSVVEVGALGSLGSVAGRWAYDALRIARGEPRFGVDTDAKSIPNELGWIEGAGPVAAVHLNKGCYRGQETVAKIHNLGRPPRRLVMLHLDGSVDRLPAAGSPVSAADDEVIGFVGSSARHYELGPIALAVVKRSTPVDAVLQVDGIPATQEVVVDPGAGLHVRTKLGVDAGERKSLLSGHA